VYETFKKQKQFEAVLGLNKENQHETSIIPNFDTKSTNVLKKGYGTVETFE
jgi:hypothetical protein